MSEEAIATGQSNTDTSQALEAEQAPAPAEGGTLLDVGGESVQPADAATETEDKVAETTESTVPEEYTFNVEGYELDDERIAAMTPIFKEMGLTQEQANKLVEAEVQLEAASEQKHTEFMQKRISEWEGELKSDPEIGGDNYEKNIGQAQNFLRTVIPEDQREEFNSMLEHTNIGNYPTFVKFVYSLSKQFSVEEDQSGNDQGGRSSAPKSDAELLYPEMGKK